MLCCRADSRLDLCCRLAVPQRLGCLLRAGVHGRELAGWWIGSGLSQPPRSSVRAPTSYIPSTGLASQYLLLLGPTTSHTPQRVVVFAGSSLLLSACSFSLQQSDEPDTVLFCLCGGQSEPHASARQSTECRNTAQLRFLLPLPTSSVPSVDAACEVKSCGWSDDDERRPSLHLTSAITSGLPTLTCRVLDPSDLDLDLESPGPGTTWKGGAALLSFCKPRVCSHDREYAPVIPADACAPTHTVLIIRAALLL